ncbi:MAG: VWA domain-containing protein [Acidobacteria bacterium]|nr:VWA domain-containing protein [Acidobacteriota bacterium]
MLIRLLAILLCLIPTFAYSQNPSEQTIKINSKLVALDAQVYDSKTNKPVNGLKKEDFQLYDEKTLQDITFFKEESLPLSIILLVESNTLSTMFAQTRLEEWSITKYLKAQDEIAIMAFGEHTKLVQPFTKDKTTVINKFKELPKVEGKLNLVRSAIYQATLLMRRANNPTGRRAIIVLTSNFSNEPLLNTGAIASKDETLEQLYESGAIVTSLVFGNTGDKLSAELLKRKYPDQILISKFFSKSNINIFANQTGGEVVPATKTDFLEKMSDQIESLRTRYSLAFIPNTENETEKFREIELKLSPRLTTTNSDYRIKTKKGYYPDRPTFVSLSEIILPKSNNKNFIRPYKIVNLMPLMMDFWAKAETQDTDAQIKLFQDTFIKTYPELFNKENLNLSDENFDKNLDIKIRAFLFDIKKQSLPFIKLSNRLISELNENEEKFLSRFSDLKWDGVIYFLPSLSSFISKQTLINKKEVLLIGVDTIAFTRKEQTQLWPIFHHELFHLYHQQFQPSAKHLNLEQPLYDFMWNEGLACYITSLLNPDTNKGEIIQLGSVKDEPKANALVIIKTLRDNLTTNSNQLYQDYFSLDTSINDKYINTGNYLSFLAAERLVLGQPLIKVLQIPSQNRQTTLDFLLRRLNIAEKQNF